MSREHFQTIFSADVRTAPNMRDIEVAESHTQSPRGFGLRKWMSCYLYAHDVLDEVARTLRSDPMIGITGDHPEKREGLAAVVERVSDAVRALATDAACDGALTTEAWQDALTAIQNAASDAREEQA